MAQRPTSFCPFAGTTCAYDAQGRIVERIEPSSTPGTYSPVEVTYLNGTLSIGSFLFPPANVGSEVYGLTQLCNFIQANGTGFGICKSCRLGALGGAKQ